MKNSVLIKKQTMINQRLLKLKRLQWETRLSKTTEFHGKISTTQSSSSDGALTSRPDSSTGLSGTPTVPPGETRVNSSWKEEATPSPSRERPLLTSQFCAQTQHADFDKNINSHKYDI